jgi:2'-5' RNA ligase
MYRLFVALELPETVRVSLAALGHGVRGARWVGVDQFHLTLRFIGEVDGVTFDDVAAALAEIEAPSFMVTISGVGHFPPSGRPRQLWAGAAKDPALMALQRAIESRVVAGGLEPEGRKFMPHVTLARLREARLSRVAEFLSAHGLFACAPFPVGSFNLYSSRLGNERSVYRIEAQYPLHQGEAEATPGDAAF